MIHSKQLVAMIVDDCSTTRELIEHLLTHQLDCVIAHSCGSTSSALAFLDSINLTSQPLDFITTDLLHEGGDGFELIAKIRAANNQNLVSGTLRARHIPIIVVSGSLSLAAIQRCRDLESSIPLVQKPFDFKELIEVILSAISDYRNRILQSLQSLGLSLFWRQGKYHIGSAYKAPALVDSDYVAGSASEAANSYARLIIVDWHWANVNLAVDRLEQMINDNSLRERDFHLFFERHPEFLLDGQYDSYWSEPRLRSTASGIAVRPDFILQPLGDRTNAWNWNLVDLKRHNVELLASRRFHVDLSRYVMRVVTQLRDYKEFFDDHRNKELLSSTFGGVVPSPRLTAVIGRLPTTEKEVLARLQHRVPDVTIKTYDEVLELRRAKVDRMSAFIPR